MMREKGKSCEGGETESAQWVNFHSRNYSSPVEQIILSPTPPAIPLYSSCLPYNGLLLTDPEKRILALPSYIL